MAALDFGRFWRPVKHTTWAEAIWWIWWCDSISSCREPKFSRLFEDIICRLRIQFGDWEESLYIGLWWYIYIYILYVVMNTSRITKQTIFICIKIHWGPVGEEYLPSRTDLLHGLDVRFSACEQGKHVELQRGSCFDDFVPISVWAFYVYEDIWGFQ